MGRLFGTGGWTFGTAGGDFGSASGKPCCLYQARLCSTGALTSLYVNKSQFPAFPSTYYFSSGGTCYYVQSSDKAACNSTPLLSGGTSYASCAACSGGAPCACSYPTGLAATYTVSGYAGLAACSGCDPDTADPQWDGTMYHIGAGCVWWAADPMFDPLSINGYSMDITYSQILLRTSPAPCEWQLYIACGSATNPTKVMWWGTNTTSTTPAGTYNFAGSDCGNTTATMTVT